MAENEPEMNTHLHTWELTLLVVCVGLVVCAAYIGAMVVSNGNSVHTDDIILFLNMHE